MKFRSVFSNALAVGLTLVLTSLGCGGAQDDYVVVSPPQNEQPVAARRDANVPDATVRQMKACVERGASRLTESSYALQYDVVANDRGDVLQVKLRDATLHDTALEGCLRQALGAMTVPVETLGLRSSRPFSGGERMKRDQRGPLSSSESDTPFVLLGPILLEAVGTQVLVEIGVTVLAGLAAIADSMNRDPKEVCQERYVECLLSEIGSRKGAVPKHSRRLWCRDGCVGNGGTWPARVPGIDNRLISCEYWRK